MTVTENSSSDVMKSNVFQLSLLDIVTGHQQQEKQSRLD